MDRLLAVQTMASAIERGKAVFSGNLVDEASDDSTKTLATAIYQKLRMDILTGDLKPGAKLRVKPITEAYGGGASPTREALNRLSAESFVRRIDQRGFQVAPVSAEDLRELTRTRILLNETIMRESIKNGDAAWEDAIILAGHRLKRTPNVTAEGEISARWESIHRAFHQSLESACNSHWLLELSNALFDYNDRYRHLSFKSSGERRDAAAEHGELMDAVLDRDADHAVKLMSEHILATSNAICDAFLREPDSLLQKKAPPKAESGQRPRGAIGKRGRSVVSKNSRALCG